MQSNAGNCQFSGDRLQLPSQAALNLTSRYDCSSLLQRLGQHNKLTSKAARDPKRAAWHCDHRIGDSRTELAVSATLERSAHLSTAAYLLESPRLTEARL
jgi:hypothetical protein